MNGTTTINFETKRTTIHQPNGHITSRPSTSDELLFYVMSANIKALEARVAMLEATAKTGAQK